MVQFISLMMGAFSFLDSICASAPAYTHAHIWGAEAGVPDAGSQCVLSMAY